MTKPTGNPTGRPPIPADRRFWSKLLVGKSSECWGWDGHVGRKGYLSKFRLGDGREVYPHRYSYEHFIGPVPEGLMIDHLCRNRACTNPFHMEPVTCQENIRRGHQARGHPVGTEIEQTDTGLATIRITPDEAREMQDRVNEIISGVLKPGKDYMQIPGTPKPSLLQPGAEALQRFFGFGSTSQTETGTLDTGEFYAKSTVQVTNQQGLVLAESTGWCDDTEKGRSGPKWKGNRNTIIQMAAKRGYVAAVRRATATSDHFTQDIEDGQQPRPPRASTPDERLLLAELFAKKGGTSIVDARAWVDSKPGRTERAWVAERVLDLMLKPDSPSTEKNGDSEASTQPAPEKDGGLPVELEPDPPLIEVTVEEDDDDTPF